MISYQGASIKEAVSSGQIVSNCYYNHKADLGIGNLSIINKVLFGK